MFTPSKYQTAIFDEVTNGRGDCVVMACPGSGKTTTLVKSSAHIATDRSLFLAFAKHNVQDLERQLPKMAVKTTHSLGMGCLFQIKKPRVLTNKYRKLCKSQADDICYSHQALDLDDYKISRDLEKLCNFARLSLTDPTDSFALKAMIAHYGIDVDFPNLLIPHVEQVLEQGAMQFKFSGEIDFTDMLWLPTSSYFSLYPRTADWTLIDEAQDLNQAQLSLVLKARDAGGRMLFCGDKRQAIMGFAGALSDSMDKIIAQTNAKVLPLSICYRCPTSHIKLAYEIYPEIEPKDNAIEGIVDHINSKDLHATVREGDLIICRMTAPLISQCIKLIAKRIPARVRGRDIGKQLTSIIEDVSKYPGYTWNSFGKSLENYLADKVNRLRQREDSENQIESIKDKVQGIQTCYEEFRCDSLEEFCHEVEELFSDEVRSVTLSTVHRAKGLESDRVFILRPDKLPLVWPNQKAHELEQEYNLKFVALTRSKKYLAFVA